MSDKGLGIRQRDLLEFVRKDPDEWHSIGYYARQAAKSLEYRNLVILLEWDNRNWQIRAVTPTPPTELSYCTLHEILKQLRNMAGMPKDSARNRTIEYVEELVRAEIKQIDADQEEK